MRDLELKEFICGFIGVITSLLVSALGGWDSAIITLTIFIVADFITGLMVASFFKKSPKSKNGALSSAIGFKGICKKVMIYLFVVVGYRIDLMLGTDYIRNAVIIGFIVNELISLTENAGLMGVPLPSIILKSIDLLKNKGGNEDENIG